MLFYRQLLAIALVALFFTNFALFAYVAGFAPPPVAYVGALAVASAPLWFDPVALNGVLRSRIFQWMILFVVLTAAWVAAQGAPRDLIELLQLRVTTTVFVVVCLLVLCDAGVHRTIRLALCGAVVLGGFLNFYEVVNPMTWSTTFGRSAGWYFNPNTSAGTMTLGVILGVGALPERFRAAFVAFGMVVVVTTLSRGAVAGWVFVLPALAIGRTVRLRRVAAAGAVLAVIGIAGLWAAGTLPQVMKALELSSEQRSRLMFSGGTQGDREATSERLESATMALQMFVESPVVGKGIGATGATAHNMYLQLAAEQGLIGFMLFPLLILAAAWGGRGGERGTALAMAVFLAWWGFFSHTLYDEFQTLLAIAVMSAIVQFGGAGNAPDDRLDAAADEDDTVTAPDLVHA